MATKSITKNISITDRRMAKGLVSALDNAEKKGAKEVVLNKRLDEVTGSRIKALLGVK